MENKNFQTEAGGGKFCRNIKERRRKNKKERRKEENSFVIDLVLKYRQG